MGGLLKRGASSPLAGGGFATWLKHELMLCTVQAKDFYATCLTDCNFLPKSPCERTSEKHKDARYSSLQGTVGASQTLLSTPPRTSWPRPQVPSTPSCCGSAARYQERQIEQQLSTA